MPRRALHDGHGLLFHVLNRSVRRVRIFSDHGDYRAFEKILTDTLALIPIRLLAYCLMPTHWHLLLWPTGDEMPRFMHRLTLTHAKRWHKAHGSEGTGPLYQNRYKAIPVQEQHHLLTVLRYIERNPLRAGLVDAAEEWRWSSLWHRCANSQGVQLTPWPMAVPNNWVELVNQPETPAELEAIRTAIQRRWPVGDDEWRELTARNLGINLRARGRPLRNRV